MSSTTIVEQMATALERGSQRNTLRERGGGEGGIRVLEATREQQLLLWDTNVNRVAPTSSLSQSLEHLCVYCIYTAVQFKIWSVGPKEPLGSVCFRGPFGLWDKAATGTFLRVRVRIELTGKFLLAVG